MLTRQEDIHLLKETLTFWNQLTHAQQSILIESAASGSYEKGTILHSADYECIGTLIVKSGSLRVYILSEDGREITLYRINEGEVCVLSASCVLQSITFDVYIDVVSDCDLIQLCSKAFASIIEGNVYAEAFTYRLTTERFSDVMWAMQQILFMSFDKRLAIFLLDEAASLHSDEIKLTHEQIARLMGSAREVVTRMLKYFSSEGYVELSRGTVKITDKNRLKSLI